MGRLAFCVLRAAVLAGLWGLCACKKRPNSKAASSPSFDRKHSRHEHGLIKRRRNRFGSRWQTRTMQGPQGEARAQCLAEVALARFVAAPPAACCGSVHPVHGPSCRCSHSCCCCCRCSAPWPRHSAAPEPVPPPRPHRSSCPQCQGGARRMTAGQPQTQLRPQQQMKLSRT